MSVDDRLNAVRAEVGECQARYRDMAAAACEALAALESLSVRLDELAAELRALDDSQAADWWKEGPVETWTL